MVLTNQSKRDSIKNKFLNAMETRQRVVKTIRDFDSSMMTHLLSTAKKFWHELKTISNISSNAAYFAKHYKIVNLFSDSFNPYLDGYYLKQIFQNLQSVKHNSLEINFSRIRIDLVSLLQPLTKNSVVLSEPLMEIRRCIAAGLNGTEAPSIVCSKNLNCTATTKTFCFLNNLKNVLSNIFSQRTNEDMTSTAENVLSQIQSYHRNIAYFFQVQPTDSYHLSCKSILHKFEDDALPAFIELLDVISQLKDFSNLNEVESHIAKFHKLLEEKLGPFFLQKDPASGWITPGYGGEYVCSWYLRQFEADFQYFARTVNKLGSQLSWAYTESKTKFDNLLEKLFSLKQIYSDGIAPTMQALQQYLINNTTKLTLSKILTGSDITMTVKHFQEELQKVITAVNSFSIGSAKLIEMILQFFTQLSNLRWQMIPTDRHDNYQFLTLMMTWNETLTAHERHLVHMWIEDYLGSKIKDTEPANIWRAAKLAIKGFETPSTGLDAFVAKIGQHMVQGGQSLKEQLEQLSPLMEKYAKDLQIGTDFFL